MKGLIEINKFRKANAILEYGVVLVIILGAMAGINAYFKRHIQSRVKRESDRYLGHGQGLEWEASIGYTDSESSLDRTEQTGADFDIVAQSETKSITVTAPLPPRVMDHKGSMLHVQDVVTKPPVPDYPDLEYKDWKDLEGDWHVPF